MPHIFRKNNAYHSRKRNAHEIQERREQSGTGRYPNRFSNSATGNKKRQQSKNAVENQAAFERQMVLLSQDSESLFASPEQSRKRRSSTQSSSKSSSASSDHIITSTSSHPASEQTRKRRFPTRRQNISRDTSSDKEDSTSPEQTVIFMAGIAGGGKSFVQDIAADFLKIFTLWRYGVLKVAPTGRAAQEMGGIIIDRCFKFNRNHTVWTPLKWGSDPLFLWQKWFSSSIAFFLDEFSMAGEKMLGHVSLRASELLNNGIITGKGFNSLPIIVLSGDLRQLPPVLDRAPWLPPRNLTQLKLQGRAVYASINSWIFLDESQRQKNDLEWLEALQKVRNGNIKDDGDMEIWNSLLLNRPGSLSNYSNCLKDKYTIFLTPTRLRRNEIFEEWLKECGENVVVHEAEMNGRTAQHENPPGAGMMVRIPRKGYYCKGMMAKLTLNVAPHLGLGANARGTIVDLIFEGAYEAKKAVPYANKARLKYIVMDIKTYSGPQLHSTLPPTYCCFGKFKCSSERYRSHYREGFPIIQGKSDTIHSAQGLSVGEEEFVKCLVLDSWESKWEKKWPGLFYVGASRACDKNSIYIYPNLDKHSLRSIGTGKTWADQNKVCQEIEQKASKERATDMNEGIGTEDDFKRLYAWFIASMSLKVSNWALGSINDEEYDQRVKTKQIITDKLNAYKLEYTNKFNETPTNINNVRRSGRRRIPTARYQ